MQAYPTTEIRERIAMTNKTRPIILASTSPYRKQLLERLNIPFEQRAPICDESAYRHLEPVEMARQLAEIKARRATRPDEDALVIGSDQVLALEGECLGKPGTRERAVEQLMALQGRTHALITAVALYESQRNICHIDVDIHTLTMHSWTKEQVARYVAADNPLDCAGAYKLESRGIALFSQIDAEPGAADDTAIVGLPLLKLLGLFRRAGLEILDQAPRA
jgi:septum formation protein